MMKVSDRIQRCFFSLTMVLFHHNETNKVFGVESVLDLF